MRTPQILQSEQHECGLACLAMVAGTYGAAVSLLGLRRRFDVGARGCSLKDIAEVAQALNMQTRGLKLEPAQLRQLRRPAILHWQMNHFVVLVAVGWRSVTIHDPAVGRRRCSWREVSEAFTGVALEVWPTREPDTGQIAPDARLSLSVLWRSVRGMGQNLLWILGLSLVLQGLLVAGPWHMQWTVDEALVGGDAELIVVLATGFALVLAVRCLVFWVRGLVVTHLGHELAYLFACRLLKAMFALPLAWFERRRVGDIQSRFASLDPLQAFLTQGASALLVDGLIVLAALVLMLAYAWQLALVVVGVQLIWLVVCLLVLPRLKRGQAQLVVAQAGAQSHLLESVRAIHSVRIYAQEPLRQTHWQSLQAGAIAHSLALERLHLHVGTLGLLTSGTELLLVVSLGAFVVLEQDGFSVGQLFAFVSYRGFFSERLQALLEQWVNLRTLDVHLERVSDIWLSESEPEPETPLVLPAKVQPLVLEGVTFGYSERAAPVLDAVDLTVAPGEMLAIVGASGSGKTTLMKMLLGMLQPRSGRVCVGSQELTPESRRAFLARCGTVLQEDRFFSGSLADNVVLFEIVDQARLDRVMRQTHLEEVVASLPMGYHTGIGEIGSVFSSGQMQRLLLARALYRAPDYLFLDEGTAHLDPHSAALLQSMLSQLSCTRVVVTHDMGFAAQADRVVCVQAGRLVAAGASP